MQPAATRDLAIDAEGARLAASLSSAHGETPQPAVILLHASGWGERRFYRPYVELFTGAGIATVTFDRRGSGDSTGDPDMDFEGWAADAVAIYEETCRQPEVDPARVALWGYSNGAWVATLAASKLPALAALVLTGTAAVSPARAETYRRVEDLRAKGIADSTLDAVREAWTLIFECTAHDLWDEDRRRRLEAARALIEADTAIAKLPLPSFVQANPRLSSVPVFDQPPLNGDLAAAAGTLPVMAFDPLPSFEQIRCPVLVVLAENDRNAPPLESFALYQEIAASREPGAFDIVMLEGSPHSFTRVPREDADLDRPVTLEEFRDDYLRTLASWLAARLQAGAATLNS